MTNTAIKPKNQAQTTRFDVHRSLQWKGKRYTGGNEIEATAPEITDAAFQAWIEHGWVSQSGVKAPPVAKAAAKPKLENLSGGFMRIQRSDIDPSPFNPRKRFGEAKLQELADSIRTDGIIEPLIVRPKKGGRFEVVGGERRYRAAGMAGLSWLPCVVREMDKVTAIRVQGIENLLRDDLNPMEECAWFRALMTEGKYTVQDIRRETGLSEASIYARLKLEDCPPGIRKALEEEKIPASTAELVARIEDSDLRFAFMDAILFPPTHTPGDEPGGVLSFRQAKLWLEQNRARLEREADWKRRSKESHVGKNAAAVLSVEESDRVLMSGGYVKDSQRYVKPTDVCVADPKQRTFEAIAKEAGRELPAPVVARDPAGGRPVVLLSRADTEKALADLVPDAAEQARRRKEAEAQRTDQIRLADQKRKDHAAAVEVRARAAVAAVAALPWTEVAEESLLRFAVRSRLDTIGDVEEDLVRMLADRGCPITKGEDALTGEWLSEYLDGCNLGQLRGWLLEFGFRDLYSDHVEEDRLAAAEEIIEAFIEPQTSAVTI